MKQVGIAELKAHQIGRPLAVATHDDRLSLAARAFGFEVLGASPPRLNSRKRQRFR